MASYPKYYDAAHAPPAILALVSRLVPALIAGEHPALATLRDQLLIARIAKVELTGVGFFVEFAVPDGTPLTEPLSFAGGRAEITLDGAIHGAGCVLFVREGRLAMFEGYTHDDEWPEDAQVVRVENIVPVSPG